jgi:hypothetical protein
MPRRHHRLAGAALCGAVFLTGCANQLGQRNEHEERVERKLLAHRLLIETGAPRQLEQPQRLVRVEEQKTFEVTPFEVTRRYQRYTPYQAWREFYEIPLGALAVVAGVGANLVDLLSFGSVPDNATRGWLDYGFAGLNPFMNAESNGRAQQNLASVDEQRGATREETTSQPWAERPVQLEVGKQHFELNTNRAGMLHLNLLDSPLAELDPMQLDRLRLRVEDPQDRSRAEATLEVERDLRGRLQEARTLVYEDLEDGDVERWVQRITRLSALGMTEQADELEQSLLELTRSDAELREELLQSLRAAGRDVVDRTHHD